MILRAITFLILFITLSITIPPWSSPPRKIGESFGTQDFVQYWSAYQITKDGGNPYDPKLMFDLQKTLDPTIESAVMMWTPPWILVLFGPLLSLSFHSAIIGWIIVNLFFVFTAAFLIELASERFSGTNCEDALGLQALIGILFFYPVLDCLFSGQVGIFLLFALSIHLYLFEKKLDFFSGMVLSLVLIKPHLFILFLPTVFAMSALERRFRLLLGFFGGLLFLLLGTVVFADNLLRFWFLSLTTPIDPLYATSITMWKSDTLVSFLRGISFQYFRYRFDSLMLIFPLISLVSLVFLLIRKRLLYSLEILYIVVLPLSVFVAPYGWFSDQALLLIPQLILLRLSRNILIPIVLIGVQVCLYLIAFFSDSHELFFLLPLLIGLVGIQLTATKTIQSLRS